MEGLAVAGGGGGGGNAAWGACACRHVATWALACLGYALPVAFQFLSEAAARRAFYRSLCRRRGCERCANAKGTDLPALALSTGTCLCVPWFFGASRRGAASPLLPATPAPGLGPARSSPLDRCSRSVGRQARRRCRRLPGPDAVLVAVALTGSPRSLSLAPSVQAYCF